MPGYVYLLLFRTVKVLFKAYKIVIYKSDLNLKKKKTVTNTFKINIFLYI